jgi:SAM-dependent methyltransferase
LSKNATHPPLSRPTGEPYERFMGRWSRQLAPRFIAWLAQRHGQRWLDVGCGTGAMCIAIADHAAPKHLIGVDPSEPLLACARETLAHRAELHVADAESLPLTDGTIDVTVSLLLLDALPHPMAAMREMQRVTRSGGMLAAAVWDYALRMRALRIFWDAAISIDPGAERFDEARRHPLCQSDALGALFERAGLQAVRTGSIEIETRFASFDDYWLPFVDGQGAAPTYVAGLSEPHRQRLRRALRSRVPIGPGGAISLAARAWVVRGMVA